MSGEQTANSKQQTAAQPSLLLTAHCLLPTDSAGSAGVPPATERSEPKRCGKCNAAESDGAEFGICRSRADGQNLYCKSCIRAKVTAQRRELKEYRAARKQRQMNLLASDEVSTGSGSDRVVAFLKQFSPVERVKDAISRGAHTRKEIRKATGMNDDQLGDVFAELLLWTREIKSEWIDHERQYFLREEANSKQQTVNSSEAPALVGDVLPARKPDVRAGFASIKELMPARITGTERKCG